MSGFPTFEEFVDGLGGWREPLREFIESSRFLRLYDAVRAEYAADEVYPPAADIFRAFQLTPPSRLSAVVVGQDPYHGPGQAMGLSFSVPRGVRKPPSLDNIFRCIAQDPAISGFSVPAHGDLTAWAAQGVFLLNDVLTVRRGKPASHKALGWQEFTNFVLRKISADHEKVVFLLWGNPARAKKKLIDCGKHCVLETSHPSPLSAANGFLTSQHFSKANEALRAAHRVEIDWRLPA